MKKIFVYSSLVFTLFIFLACKKCTTCGFDYSLNGVKYADMKEEVCGKKKEIENYKSECESTAALYGVKCTCIDK